MDHRSDPSVDELRRQTENTRASLTATVDKLRETVEDTASEWKAKVSPDHIKQEVKDYVREGGERLTDSLKRKVRENPLQALAIGAGVAYPLIGLLRTIPIPVLLIGVGYALAQRKSGHSNGYAGSGVHATTDTDTNSVTGQIRRSAQETSEQIGRKASDAADQMRRSVHDARDAAKRMSDDLTEKAQSAAGAIGASAESALHKVSEVSDRSRHALMDTIDRNPLLVAGVGLAVGAFIAACLPASRAENRLLGETSDQLKRKAGLAASETMDRAKEVVDGVIGDVAETAGREGLDASHARTLADNMVSGVKTIAERGIDAAFEEPGPSENQTSQQPVKTWMNQ